MDKIELIDSYINRCDEVLDSRNYKDALTLQNEIIGVFGTDVKNITSMLDTYLPHFEEERADCIGDANLLKMKLINYRTDLEREKEKQKYDLELARLQQPNMTQTAHITVNVSIDQTIEQIKSISPNSLSDADKENLINDLYDIEKHKQTGNKTKAWDVAKGVLKFLADKGADAAVASLPLIIQGLQKL